MSVWYKVSFLWDFVIHSFMSAWCIASCLCDTWYLVCVIPSIMSVWYIISCLCGTQYHVCVMHGIMSVWYTVSSCLCDTWYHVCEIDTWYRVCVMHSIISVWYMASCLCDTQYLVCVIVSPTPKLPISLLYSPIYFLTPQLEYQADTKLGKKVVKYKVLPEKLTLIPTTTTYYTNHYLGPAIPPLLPSQQVTKTPLCPGVRLVAWMGGRG